MTRTDIFKISLLSLSIALTGCKDGSSNHAGDSFPLIPLEPSKPVIPLIPLEPSKPIPIPEFNIVDVEAGNNKTILFTWDGDTAGITFEVCEKVDATAETPDGCLSLGSTDSANTISIPVTNLIATASKEYFIKATRGTTTTLSNEVMAGNYVITSLMTYIKASNSGENDTFGSSISLSADGNTLVVGAFMEGSSATGVNGDQTDDGMFGSGAVYVFKNTNGTWAQTAYIKASNTGEYDNFGESISLSADGNTLAIGGDSESSSATGVNGDQNNTDMFNAGAVYVY